MIRSTALRIFARELVRGLHWRSGPNIARELALLAEPEPCPEIDRDLERPIRIPTHPLRRRMDRP